MITDFQILGMEETTDLQAIKSAFRKRAKELHPDLAGGEDALRRHDLFVEVCHAYRRLTEHAPAEPHTAAPCSPSARAAGSLARYSDQAYGFYKAGMKYFSAIHPSAWNMDTGRMLNTAIAGHAEDQDIIKRKVMDLVKLFPKAYYYFSIVVHEYPDSDWAYDAGAKLSTIEERVRRYRHIIESFSSWNIDKEERIKDYHEKFDANVRTLKAVRRDLPREWEE